MNRMGWDQSNSESGKQIFCLFPIELNQIILLLSRLGLKFLTDSVHDRNCRELIAINM